MDACISKVCKINLLSRHNNNKTSAITLVRGHEVPNDANAYLEPQNNSTRCKLRSCFKAALFLKKQVVEAAETVRPSFHRVDTTVRPSFQRVDTFESLEEKLKIQDRRARAFGKVGGRCCILLKEILKKRLWLQKRDPLFSGTLLWPAGDVLDRFMQKSPFEPENKFRSEE